MTGDLFDLVVVPIASEADAEATCRALKPRVADRDGRIVVVHVIEKAGGAPDKASVEQREEHARDIFAAAEASLADTGVPVETELLYGTDVAEAILRHAAAVDATAIAFTPRGASRWKKLLTGNIAERLVSEADRPVVVLSPDER